MLLLKNINLDSQKLFPAKDVFKMIKLTISFI
jgi:hypothetical protein